MGYTTVDIPVTGGALRAGVWGTAGPLVIAAHGVTAQHQAWALVGPDLGRDHRFVALDLRGRGGSRDLPGPYGVAAHAADVAAAAGYFGGPAIMVGHSMGGMVMVAAARRGAGSRLVLVDGGPLLPPPFGIGPDPSETEIFEMVAGVLGPAFGRLSMTFATRAEYLEFWRAHPALTDWTEAMTAFVEYDLVGGPGAWRPACRLAAAHRDARDLYNFTGEPEEPVPVPALLLRAERGMFDEPDKPFYSPGYAQLWLPGVEEISVPGVNHYTITLAPAGAEAVVAAVRGG